MSAVVVSFNPNARLGIRALARRSSPPPLAPRLGLPAPWEPSLSVYNGVADLATGNLALVKPVTGWSSLGPGVNLTLYANSAGGGDLGLGPGWRHSYAWTVTESASVATLTRGDGRQIAFARSGANYAAEAGYDERLSANAGGGWTLTYKDGSTLVFGPTGLLLSQRDASGNATTLAYANGLLTSVTDAAGRVLAFTYANGKLTGVTDPEGRAWGFLYTGGRLTRVNDPVLDGQILGTGYAYDGDGHVSGVTDRLNRTWSYTYGTDGNFLTVTDPLNHTAGQSVATTAPKDPTGFQSANPSGATPDANPATYPVDTVATVYVQDAGGNPAEYGMDAGGRLTASRDGLGNQTNVQWNAQNCLVARITPDGKATTSTYDTRRNLTGTTDPTGRSVTMTYSANDDVLTRVDASGTATFTYDGAHHVLSSTDASGRTTSIAYNPNGTAASSTDGAGKVTTYGYDGAGNLNRVTDPIGNATAYVYALDLVTSRTDARGCTTLYGYDRWKRLKGVDYPQSADQSFDYDAEGRMTRAVDGTGERTYTYDALGRKTDQTDPRGNTHATYDDASRLLSQTDVTGRLVQYGYDARGLMTGVSDPLSSAAYTYDSVGRLKTTTYNNGVVSTYGYDDAGRTSTLTHVQNRTTIAAYTSTYDPAGRLSQVQESGSGGSATTTYSYDPANRLLTENRAGANPYASTYTYNSRGLRATAFRSENGVTSHNGTYTYDDAGRLTGVADTVPNSALGGAYTWNPDGTLVSSPGRSGRREFGYNEEGQMTLIRENGVGRFEYGYGFDGGRRWSKDLSTPGQMSWYPCGVACCAGELVELKSTDGGSSWSVSALSITGIRPETKGDSVLLPSIQGDAALGLSSSALLRWIFDSLGTPRKVDASPVLLFARGYVAEADIESSLAAVGLDGVLRFGGPGGGKGGRPGGSNNGGRPGKPKPGKPKPGRPGAPKPGGGLPIGGPGDIVKGIGKGLVVANLMCGAAIALIADDVHNNKPGPITCGDICKAIETIHQGQAGWPAGTGLAYGLGCKTAEEIWKAGCGCK